MTSETDITTSLGVLNALLFVGLMIAVYVNAVITNKISWESTEDENDKTSISRSMAAMGRNVPFITVVVILNSILFVLTTLRQKLYFPILPFLFSVGLMFFSLLPVVTAKLSLIAHFILTFLFIVLTSVAMVLTTKYLHTYGNVAYKLMIFTCVLALISILGLIITTALQLTPEIDEETNNKVFTIFEFVFGGAVFTWLLAISLPLTL